MSQWPAVLIVEGNETATFLTRRLLQRLGAAKQVRFVADGAQALTQLTGRDAAGALSPALILLDLRLPALDGWAFLEAYQRLPAYQRQAPVIVLVVALPCVADLERLHSLPIAGLLEKPLTAEKMASILQLFAPVAPPS